MASPAERGCYCKEGDTSCGSCQVCGEPGHTRAMTGEVPYTGAWCDDCYARLAQSQSLGRWVQIGFVLLILIPPTVLLYRCVR